MRRTISFIAMFLAAGTTLLASVIVQWDFNSETPDDDVATGNLFPSFGHATATLIGSVTGTFVTGDTKHDPAGSADNSGWRTTKYPPADAPNKTDGVRFDVDTTGYQGIVLTWFLQNSATASRYARLQYTLNGFDFLDADSISVPLDGVFTAQTVSLENIPAAGNNPAFAFRIVTEWESTASGSGADNYIATKPSSKYSTSGTIRFDMVTVSGLVIPGANTPPVISSVPDQILRVNASCGPLEIIVSDAEDSPDSLILTASSSDPNVVPPANITLGGSGSIHTLTIAAGDQPGSSTITVTVTDSGGRWASTRLNATVLVANTVPIISVISSTNTLVNSPTTPIEFMIGDGETPAANLTLTGGSLNTALVSSDAIVFGGGDSNRTVVVNPIAGRTGVAPIRVTVSDGTNSADSIFSVMVTPTDSVIFCDPFDYPDGSVHTNSGFLWATRSGTEGECQVASGQLELCSSRTEDVVAPLVGGPYARTSSAVLFASFNFNFSTLPKAQPGLFAHFSDGSVLRGRLYVGITNALAGCFRLAVANGAGDSTQIDRDLYTNQTYRIILRYNIAAATTTAWLEPAQESDSGTTASDLQSPAPVASFGFRQDSDVGATVLIDDLLVGLSFDSVASNQDLPPVISPIVPQVLRLLSTSAPLAFTIGDAEEPPGNLLLTASSSNPSVLPEANILFDGSGSNHTVTLVTADLPGSSVITLYVTDSAGKSSCSSFEVTVLPDNTAPSISAIASTNTLVNVSSSLLNFIIFDAETPAEDLRVSASSQNPSLVPNENIVLGGLGSNRTVYVVPATGKTGVAIIGVSVSDGTNQSSASFGLMVTPSERVLFCDRFEYDDGTSLTSLSPFWTTRSGPPGECHIRDGRLLLNAAQREDVVAPLLGAPYDKNDLHSLYASFRFTFTSLPKSEPGLFAHFAGGNTLRGRVYAGTTNAASGCFRLSVANGSALPAEWPLDLQLNTVYTAVTRYVIATATTSFWLNPSFETDPSLSAIDEQPPVAIVSYGFREDADIGAAFWVDDLMVGYSYLDVMPSTNVAPAALTYGVAGGQVWLSWNNPSLWLQAASNVLGPFEDIPGTSSPYTNRPSGPARFFRLKSH